MLKTIGKIILLTVVAACAAVGCFILSLMTHYEIAGVYGQNKAAFWRSDIGNVAYYLVIVVLPVGLFLLTTIAVGRDLFKKK